MSRIVITIVNSSTEADTIFRLNPYVGDKHVACQRLSRMIDSMSADMETKLMTIAVDGGVGGALAVGTLTGTAVVAGATAVVGTQTFTASATPSGPNQFAVGATTAATMANLAAAINANPDLVNVASATVPAATPTVVSVRASLAGTYGNAITLTGSATIAASASTLTGGVQGTGSSYTFAGLI